MSLQPAKETRKASNKPRNLDNERSGTSSGKDGAPASESLATEVANMHQLLKQMDTSQKTTLAEIKQTTAAISEKLEVFSERLDNVESRLSALEDATETSRANPPAPMSELVQMQKWVDDLEARSRRNNLRIRGFPEGCEGDSAVNFLEKVLPEILDIDFPRGLIIERAHRTLAPHQKGHPPRAIIAKFLCFQDVSRIQRAARTKGELAWDSNKISIFPDYTKAVERQRQKFKECKMKLKERHIDFALVYPATLKIFPENGPEHRFDDAGKALEFINQIKG